MSGQRIGTGSLDAIAGPLKGMFNFNQAPSRVVYLLNPSTGQVVAKSMGKSSLVGA